MEATEKHKGKTIVTVAREQLGRVAKIPLRDWPKVKFRAVIWRHLFLFLSAIQSPDYVHQIVDFADDGRSARTQVVLHTESCKKGQDQFRKGVRIHLWALDLNILGDELL
jgi:hypothetical protein